MLLYALKVIAAQTYSAAPSTYFEAPEDNARQLIACGAAVPALPSREGLVLSRPLTISELEAANRTCREYGLPSLDAAQRVALLSFPAAPAAPANEEAA